MEIDCQSVKAKLDAGRTVLLLDCRESTEWDLVRIDGALLVPMSEIRDRLGELEPHREAEVIVYCHHGVRSRHVARWLRQQGFASAFSMSGGIDAWTTEIDSTLPRY